MLWSMLLREDNKEALQPVSSKPISNDGFVDLNEQGGLTEDNLTVFQPGVSSGLSMGWFGFKVHKVYKILQFHAFSDAAEGWRMNLPASYYLRSVPRLVVMSPQSATPNPALLLHGGRCLLRPVRTDQSAETGLFSGGGALKREK